MYKTFYWKFTENENNNLSSSFLLNAIVRDGSVKVPRRMSHTVQAGARRAAHRQPTRAYGSGEVYRRRARLRVEDHLHDRSDTGLEGRMPVWAT